MIKLYSTCGSDPLKPWLCEQHSFQRRVAFQLLATHLKLAGSKIQVHTISNCPHFFFQSSIHLLNIEYVSTFDRHRAQDKLKKPDASNPSLVIQPWKTFDEENNTRQLYYCSALLIIYSQNISCPILGDMSKTFWNYPTQEI